MRLLHDVVRKKRAVLPKTRNITVWNIPPKFMPLYYTNADETATYLADPVFPRLPVR